MGAIKGFCIVEDTLAGYDIVWRTGEGEETMPIIWKDEEAAWKEIAENIIDQLQEFIDGDRELADTAFETMEVPAEIEIDEEGNMVVHVPMGEPMKMSIQSWQQSL